MASPIDYVKDVAATHDKKNNKASKFNLAVAASLATIFLMSGVAVLGPTGSQAVWAAIPLGVNSNDNKCML